MTAKYFIDSLQLKPHPEGGFFKETYRSSGTIALKCLPLILMVNVLMQLAFIFYYSKDISQHFIALPVMSVGIFTKAELYLFIS